MYLNLAKNIKTKKGVAKSKTEDSINPKNK
jgi:hypothetical protein